MTKELTIVTETGMQFDKNDIAAIAVAEAEKKMRMTIKALRAQLTETDENIESIKDEIQILGEETIKLKVNSKIKTIKAGLKATKIKDLVVEVQPSISVYPSDDTLPDYMINSYNIRIGIWDKNTKALTGHNMAIESNCLTATQTQKTAMRTYQMLNEQKAQLTQDALEWRRKLGDIAAMERQIKAALAKRQIESAKGGKELIKDLLKNFENDMKLLGD